MESEELQHAAATGAGFPAGAGGEVLDEELQAAVAGGRGAGVALPASLPARVHVLQALHRVPQLFVHPLVRPLAPNPLLSLSK